MTHPFADPRQAAVDGWPLAPRVEPASTEALAAPLGTDVLAAIHFGDTLPDTDPRRVQVPLPLASGSGNAGEIWRVGETVDVVGDASQSCCSGGGVALLRVQIDEAALNADLEVATADAYSRLLNALSDSGYPYPLRMWNYLSSINRGEGDGERYRRFCVGRGAALSSAMRPECLLPAATAIGSAPGNGLLVYALAARQPGTQIENPRQVSAFRYPRDYGRQSPSFSRATRVAWADQATLYVSGTASIVGHRTVHVGDVGAQLRQAANNIRAVCEEAADAAASERFEPTACTVYVRRPADVGTVVSELAGRMAIEQPRVCIGDVCRRDLDVEIEATCRLRVSG